MGLIKRRTKGLEKRYDFLMNQKECNGTGIININLIKYLKIGSQEYNY